MRITACTWLIANIQRERGSCAGCGQGECGVSDGEIDDVSSAFYVRRIFQYYFSKGMNFAYFPLRQFTEALGVTAKVKSRLQPFIQEVENYNMEWLFQMLMELYTYTISPDCQLIFKFNSLVALKILLDTCEVPVILLTEIYFLPHVRKIATYQLHATQKQRGLDYFLSLGYTKGTDIKKLGYNYVRLASEIVTMMAVVKPYRLYRDQELAEASEFANALDIMRAQQWREYDIFAFYQEEEGVMRETFLSKLKNFARYSERYYDFLDTYLDKLIRKEYSPKVLDPRKILEAGQVFASNYVLEALRDLLNESRVSIKTNVLRLFTDFVRWGYIRAAYLIECEGVFEGLVKQVQMKMSDRGKSVFRGLNGTDEERRNLYTELVRSLQIWAVCIPKNPMNLEVESKSSLLYKEFLSQKVEVPFSGNIKKIRDECEANLEKNRLINMLIMKELKKHDFDASKMRRTSSNLEELINLDKNMSNSMASLIMQAKFINDLPRPEDTNSNSSLTTNFCAHTHPISTNFEQISDKENTKPISKHHKTVSLSNLISKTSITRPFIPDPRSNANFHCLPECDSDSDDENYSEDCDQNFKINQLRSIRSKNSFNTTDIRKFQQLAQQVQVETVKPDRNHPENKDEQELIEFFEETIRSPASSTRTQESFIIEVTKPSPLKQPQTPIKMLTPIKTSIIRVNKEKASPLHSQKKFGFPVRNRNNQLTVAIDKNNRRMEYIRNRASEGGDGYRESWNDYLPDEECMSFDVKTFPSEEGESIDEERFAPYLDVFSQIEGKKLVRNKDILLKTSKIEIGFIFELISHQTSLLTIFITPEEKITHLKWQMSCPSSVSYSQRGDNVNQIPKHKQRRLIFQFLAKPPYSLPRLSLQYEMEGKEYRHTLIMPISFNKFIKYTSIPQHYSSPLILRTPFLKLNTQDFHVNQITTFFQDFTAKTKEGTVVQITGRGEYGGTGFNICLLLRDANLIQIRCEMEGEGREAVQFLMAVLLSILKK